MRTKLLLADDSITIQKVVGIIFASEDYELAIVNNGDAALAKAREIVPDVLLVDAVMPGKTGYEVCEEIRRDPALKGTPILLLTGAFEPFDEGKARQSGADDFISKPFESQHLIEKVISLAELGGERKTVGSEPPAAPVAPQAVSESPEFIFAEEEPAPVEVVQAAPAAAPEFELEIVEGTADDDLWGAFELEDVSEGEVAESEATPFEIETMAAGEEELSESFAFTEDEKGLPAMAADSAGFAPEWEKAGEADFSFQEEAEATAFELAPGEEFGAFEEEATPVFETGPAESGELFDEMAGTAVPALSDIKPYAPPAEHEFDLQFAPEEEYVRCRAPERHLLEVDRSRPAHATSPAVGVELNEEQLTALVGKISRDIIEKIVWEVVPDLAERIISEEIRKIKEGN